MRTSIFILMVCFPFILLAQKGTIIPDVRTQPTSSTPDDIKVWTIEDNLVDCPDSTGKCYSIKENGVSKTVAVSDVLDFSFEPGTKYSVWVKQELKKPPINAYASLYTYRVTKIITPKTKTGSDIPVVTKQEIENNTESIPTVADAPAVQQTNNTDDKPVYYTTKLTPTEEQLSNDVAELKKQIRELKKQVEVMQLQLDMQLKLLDKK